VQHELRRNMGITVAYYRTWYGGFVVTDNQATTPADYDEYCITVPKDSRLPGGGGNPICGLYDIKPTRFGSVANLVTQATHYGKQIEVFTGFDVTLSTRFAQGGQVQGGMSTGRTVTDTCAVNDLPQVTMQPNGATANVVSQKLPEFCHVSRPWAAATQVKFSLVYPLPWDIQTGAIFQDIPGFPIAATYVATNAEVRPALGRDLGSCRGAATCNANTPAIDLIQPNTRFEHRIRQLDLRVARIFQFGMTRLRANFDVYNLFNASAVLNAQTRYSNQNNQWLNAIQIMGGRVVTFSTQLEF